MMLETMVTQQVAYYFVGAAIAVGIAAKLLAGISLKRLVRASSNMGKSNHALMRLVRAKFEHACMVSDKVQNIGAFVDKYLYEYRILGFRLHTLRRLEGMSVWLCVLFAAAGAGLEYAVLGPTRNVYQYLVLGGAGALFLFLLRGLTDEKYQREAARMYMVDFLENTYARRYEKPRQNEFQVTVQKTAEVPYTDPPGQEIPPIGDPTILPGNTPGVQPGPVPQTEPERQPRRDELSLELEDDYELDETPVRFWEDRSRPRSTAPMPQAEYMNPEPRTQTASSTRVRAVYDECGQAVDRPPDAEPDEPGSRKQNQTAAQRARASRQGDAEEAPNPENLRADSEWPPSAAVRSVPCADSDRPPSAAVRSVPYADSDRPPSAAVQSVACAGAVVGSAGRASARQMAAETEASPGGREPQSAGRSADSPEQLREARIREILEEFLVT